MKQIKIFPKTFAYTLGLMLFIVGIAHVLLYFFTKPEWLVISVNQHNDTSFDTSLNIADYVTKVVIKALPLSLICCVFISIICSFLFSRKFTVPIKHISTITEQMAQMKKDAVCNISSKDEIGILAENINYLYQSLLSTIENLEIEKQRVNESEKSIRRYIRLTKLIPELLTMVDNDALKLSPSMAISPAYEVSFLTQDEQKSLLDFMQCYDCTPSHAQAIELKNHSQKGTLTVDYMEELLSEEKPNQIPKIGVSMERLVFPDNIKSDKEREDFIVKAVRFYVNYQRKKQKQNQSR